MAATNWVDLAATAEQGTMLAAGMRSLADVLASGPLPLGVAVAYAREIAAGAAAFHRGGRAYGALAPSWITVGPHGLILPPPNGASRFATPSSDLRDFGLLLHQMLTSSDPRGSSPPASADDALEPSPETVRSAALRLAERCRRAPGGFDLRRVSTELRLLQVVVNSFGPCGMVEPAFDERPAERPAVPAVPAKPVKAGARGSSCPSCGSSAVFPSQRLTLLEKLLAVVDLKTYRCYGCCQRFISVFGLRLPRPEKN
ncbi:MAG: hypothetical protein WBL61_19310 [Bryobacteraceae bacterium]